MSVVGAAAGVPFLDLAAVNRGFRREHERAWRALMDHGCFVGGPEVERFEEEFADYCGAARCVGVANGTDALELILRALGIGRGDEVIVQANTFVATVEAICAAGAVPVFVDVLPGTLQMDPSAVAAAVTPRTAGIIAVHLYGQMADVDALGRVARRHGLALVEDAAQAHGARLRGVRAGAAGAAAGFSFYPGKNLGAFGDAGAVVTSDAALADRVRRIADHGRDPDDRRRHDLRGRNSRLDSIQAAVLSAKLRRLDEDNAGRVRAMETYRRLLPPACRVLDEHPDSHPVHHLAVVRSADRDRLAAGLTAGGIGWSVHYPVPCHLQPAYAEFMRDRLPVAEEAADEIISLPMWPTISDEEIVAVCEAAAEALA